MGKEVDSMKFDRKIDDQRLIKFCDQPYKVIELKNYCYDTCEEIVIQKIIDT